MAFESALKIFELSVLFPKDGPESLCSQVVRSSSGVCMDLLEAWQNRDKNDILLERLDQASIDASDTQDHIEKALEIGLIDHKTAVSLFTSYSEIMSEITKMLKDRKQYLLQRISNTMEDSAK
jgi:four helix bundle protein